MGAEPLLTSHEKIRALRAELSGPGEPEEDPRMGMIRTAAAFLGPMLDLILPADPAELDEGLDWAAAQALALRSDPGAAGLIELEAPA